MMIVKGQKKMLKIWEQGEAVNKINECIKNVNQMCQMSNNTNKNQRLLSSSNFCRHCSRYMPHPTQTHMDLTLDFHVDVLSSGKNPLFSNPIIKKINLI